MATQEQIDLAKKYYTQDQINQELAKPGSVKRVDALGAPQYEQIVNGQFASATKTPTVPTTTPKIPDVGQNSNSVNAGGETIYNFAAQTPQAPTVPTVPPVPTIPGQPVPGSASSILGDGFGQEDPFIKQYQQDQLNQYNQTIDPQAAYNEQLALRQAQIDATNALYRDQLNQARIQGQGRLGSGGAIQARRGLLGSSFGEAQTNKIQSANTDIENTIEQERLAVVNQILTNARTSAAADIAEKRAAKEAGGKAYLEYLSGADTRKQAKVSKAAQLLLSLGKSPTDISDEELKQAGISRQDLTMEYTTGKAAQDAAAAKAQAESEKTSLENAKTEAEINQIYGAIAKAQAEGSKYYEVGNKIYEMGTNKFISNAEFNPYSQFQVTQGNQVYDPVTNTFSTPPTPGATTGDLRQYASQYPNEASLKNNNPAGITFSQGFADRLTQAGIQFQKGTNRPANEGGSYFGFPTIEEGMKAYDLLWSSPSYTGLTLNQALNRWNTGSTEKGYGTQISGEVGVNGNTRVSDLSPDQLRAVQMAQLKRESPGMYKVLNSGGANGTIGGYIQPTGSPALDMQQVELPEKATEFAKKSYGFGVRMAEAEKSISAIEKAYANSGTTAEFIGSNLPSFLQGAERQQFEQAKRNFVNSVLRNESGAVIADSEFKNADKQYFPQPGDTPAVLEQKRLNRETALLNMFSSAGKDAKGNNIKDIYNQVKTPTGGVQQNTGTTPPATGTNDAYALYLKSIGQ